MATLEPTGAGVRTQNGRRGTAEACPLLGQGQGGTGQAGRRDSLKRGNREPTSNPPSRPKQQLATTRKNTLEPLGAQAVRARNVSSKESTSARVNPRDVRGVLVQVRVSLKQAPPPMDCVGGRLRRKRSVREGSNKKLSRPAGLGRLRKKRTPLGVPRSKLSMGTPQGTKVTDSLLQAQGVKRRTSSKQVQDRATHVWGRPKRPPQSNAVSSVKGSNPASPGNSELEGGTKRVPPDYTPRKQRRHSKGLCEQKPKRTVAEPLVGAVTLQQVKVALRQRQAVKGLGLATRTPTGVVTTQLHTKVPVTGDLGNPIARDSKDAGAVQ